MPKFDIPGESAPRGDTVGAPSSRRWLPLLALAALLLFAGVGGALAWRQYRDSERTDLRDARAKAVVAANAIDSVFNGEIASLRAVAAAPVVLQRNRAGMLAYFRRVAPGNGQQFTGGVAWIDRQGKVRVSTNGTRPGPVADVSDRSYFRQAIRNGLPFVSEGLTSRVSHRQVIVISVPTRDAHGEITGCCRDAARQTYEAR